MLDIDIGKLAARRYSELIAVNHDTHSHASSSGTEPEIASAFTGFVVLTSVSIIALNMAAPPPHTTSRRCNVALAEQHVSSSLPVSKLMNSRRIKLAN